MSTPNERRAMTIPGIRREDIRPCDGCGEGLLNGGQIAAYRVEVTQYVVDRSAVQRQAGLEMMLGSASIAHVMGQDEEFLKAVSKSDALYCQRCFIDPDKAVAEAWEDGGKHGRGAGE